MISRDDYYAKAKERGWREERCSSCHFGLRASRNMHDMSPEECPHCNQGYVWVSPKGRIADYPGGPFRGMA